MATLSAEVQLRIPAQLLVALTNDNLPAATTLDTTKLDAAIADVVNDFADRGLVLDTAAVATRHVAAAVKGVIFHLYNYKSNLDAAFARAEEDYLMRLRPLIGSTSRDRIEPSTNSQLSVTPELADGQDIRYQPFDESRFRGIAATPPRGGEDSYNDRAW